MITIMPFNGEKKTCIFSASLICSLQLDPGHDLVLEDLDSLVVHLGDLRKSLLEGSKELLDVLVPEKERVLLCLMLNIVDHTQANNFCLEFGETTALTKGALLLFFCYHRLKRKYRNIDSFLERKSNQSTYAANSLKLTL